MSPKNHLLVVFYYLSRLLNTRRPTASVCSPPTHSEANPSNSLRTEAFVILSDALWFGSHTHGKETLQYYSSAPLISEGRVVLKVKPYVEFQKLRKNLKNCHTWRDGSKMHYHRFLKLLSSYYGHDKEREVIKTLLLIIKRRTVSINKVQLLAAFWVLMPANLCDSVRMNLSQSSQPPAPVAANLSSRDPAAQQTTRRV